MAVPDTFLDMAAERGVPLLPVGWEKTRKVIGLGFPSAILNVLACMDFASASGPCSA